MYRSENHNTVLLAMGIVSKTFHNITHIIPLEKDKADEIFQERFGEKISDDVWQDILESIPQGVTARDPKHQEVAFRRYSY